MVRKYACRFLNFDLVQFVFSLPSSFKIRDGFTKYILRKTMNGKVPDAVLWKPEKTGFETPQKSWMENKTMQELIHRSKEKLVHSGILKPVVLQQKIVAKDIHSADNSDWRYLSLAQII